MLEIGDVGEDRNGSAVAGPAFGDENPAAVAALLKPRLPGIAVDCHALRDPFVDSVLGIGDIAALGGRSDDRLERHSGLDREVRFRIEQLAVSGIAEHEAILGVEEHEPLGRVLDGVDEPAARVLRLLEETLDLVEETRSFDRGGGIGGEGPCHVGMLGGVEVGVQLVEGEHPDQAVTEEQRHAHPPLDAPAAMGLVLEMLEARGDVGDDDRLASLHHLAGRVVGSTPVEALSEEFVEIGKAVSADDDHLAAVDLLDAAAVVGHDLAQFGQDQIEDLRQTQRAVERLGGGAQRLGLLARRARFRRDAHSRSHGSRGRRTTPRAGRVPACKTLRPACPGEHADEVVAGEQWHAHPTLDTPAAMGLLPEMLELGRTRSR